MIILSVDQIISLHTHLISETGGINGIRDKGLLESAIHTPFQSFGGTDAYPSLQQKAARLCFGLIRNHAFLDGNKRIGVHAMLVFLSLNNIELEYSQEDLSDIILKVASNDCSFEDLLKWVLSHQL